MSVINAATELGNEITKSKEYVDLKTSQKMLEGSEEAKNLISDMNLLQREYVKTVQENLGEDAVKSMENLLKNQHDELLRNEITHYYIKAKEVFDLLMKDVNKTIADAINGKSDCSSCGSDCGECEK